MEVKYLLGSCQQGVKIHNALFAGFQDSRADPDSLAKFKNIGRGFLIVSSKTT
jgi:hypothetical protein